jgi:hypothetical protein
MSWIETFKNSTTPDYFKYISSARSEFLNARIALSQNISNMYTQYAMAIEKQIRDLGVHTLQTAQLEQLAYSMRQEAAHLATGLTTVVNDSMVESMRLATDPSKYALLKASKGVLNEAEVKAYFVKVNSNALSYFMSKTEHNPLFISQRVWGIAAQANTAIVGILKDSIAVGADSFKTARLLGAYVQGSGTAQRALIRQLKDGGIKKYYVPKDISFEALRLARTETSMAFMEGTYKGGQANPLYRGINWLLSANHMITDICDDYAAQGFFAAGEEPELPHPQCGCTQVDVFEDAEDAANDLKDWVNDPSSHPELEQWYNEQYLPALGKEAIEVPSAIAFSENFDSIARSAGWTDQQLAAIKKDLSTSITPNQSASQLAKLRSNMERQYGISKSTQGTVDDLMQAWLENSSDLASTLNADKLLLNWKGMIAEQYDQQLQKALTFRSMFAQQYAKAIYGDTITLYRAVDDGNAWLQLLRTVGKNNELTNYMQSAQSLREFDVNKLRTLLGKDAKTILKFNVNALSSWSSDPTLIDYFGNVTLKQTFATADIFTAYAVDPVLTTECEEFIMTSLTNKGTVEMTVEQLLMAMKRSPEIVNAFVDALGGF